MCHCIAVVPCREKPRQEVQRAEVLRTLQLTGIAQAGYTTQYKILDKAKQRRGERLRPRLYWHCIVPLPGVAM